MAAPYETMDIVALTSAARTASFNTELFRYTDNLITWATFIVDVTAVSGTTPTMTLQIQWRDPASGKWYNIPWAVTASITTTGTYVLTVWSGLTTVANSVVNAILPATIRLSFTIGGTTPSFTFTAGITYSA